MNALAIRIAALSLLPLLAPCSASSLGTRGRVERPRLADRPSAHASHDFWRTWGDGRAELASYDAVVPRYGQLWPAELVLIYVTEPLDRRTLIKDDEAPQDRRLNVLKLNVSLKFQTGIYPYSVLTSVFAPVDAFAPERFSPVKLTLSAQEWCGHVFLGVWPGTDRFVAEGYSYFASEGETAEDVPAQGSVVYEDALLVQLRELDGPFFGGRDFEGLLVPSLFRNRRAHEPLRPVHVRITRSAVGDSNRFVIATNGFTRTIDIERAGAHRVLGWTTSDGETARLRASDRLPYWQMHDHGGEAERARIGLDATPIARPEPPAGVTRVGF